MSKTTSQQVADSIDSDLKLVLKKFAGRPLNGELTRQLQDEIAKFLDERTAAGSEEEDQDDGSYTEL